MIERVLSDGSCSPCELRAIRKGDWFRTRDHAGTGPWIEAAADATLMADPARPQERIWHVITLPYAVVPL
jgi:hypothetical protein